MQAFKMTIPRGCLRRKMVHLPSAAGKSGPPLLHSKASPYRVVGLFRRAVGSQQSPRSLTGTVGSTAKATVRRIHPAVDDRTGKAGLPQQQRQQLRIELRLPVLCMRKHLLRKPHLHHMRKAVVQLLRHVLRCTAADFFFQHLSGQRFNILPTAGKDILQIAEPFFTDIFVSLFWHRAYTSRIFSI